MLRLCAFMELEWHSSWVLKWNLLIDAVFSFDRFIPFTVTHEILRKIVQYIIWLCIWWLLKLNLYLTHHEFTVNKCIAVRRFVSLGKFFWIKKWVKPKYIRIFCKYCWNSCPISWPYGPQSVWNVCAHCLWQGCAYTVITISERFILTLLAELEHVCTWNRRWVLLMMMHVPWFRLTDAFVYVCVRMSLCHVLLTCTEYPNGSFTDRKEVSEM